MHQIQRKRPFTYLEQIYKASQLAHRGHQPALVIGGLDDTRDTSFSILSPNSGQSFLEYSEISTVNSCYSFIKGKTTDL